MSRDSSAISRGLPRAAFLRRDDNAQRLVGLGFRYWVSGYQSGDIDRWEKAWKIYSSVLGPQAARTAVGELSALGACRQRARRGATSKFAPGDCAGFCRDECLAVSMIAACQHNTCPAMRACAFAPSSKARSSMRSCITPAALRSQCAGSIRCCQRD